MMNLINATGEPFSSPKPARFLFWMMAMTIHSVAGVPMSPFRRARAAWEPVRLW